MHRTFAICFFLLNGSQTNVKQSGTAREEEGFNLCMAFVINSVCICVCVFFYGTNVHAYVDGGVYECVCTRNILSNMRLFTMRSSFKHLSNTINLWTFHSKRIDSQDYCSHWYYSILFWVQPCSSCAELPFHRVLRESSIPTKRKATKLNGLRLPLIFRNRFFSLYGNILNTAVVTPCSAFQIRYANEQRYCFV